MHISKHRKLDAIPAGELLGATVNAWVVQRENAGLSLKSSHFVQTAKGLICILFTPSSTL